MSERWWNRYIFENFTFYIIAAITVGFVFLMSWVAATSTYTEFLCKDADNIENLNVVSFNDDGELVCLNTTYSNTTKSNIIAGVGILLFFTIIFTGSGYIPIWC